MDKYNIDQNGKNVIMQEIDRLKRENAKMREQVEQEINRNQWHIFALERLLEQAK